MATEEERSRAISRGMRKAEAKGSVLGRPPTKTPKQSREEAMAALRRAARGGDRLAQQLVKEADMHSRLGKPPVRRARLRGRM